MRRIDWIILAVLAIALGVGGTVLYKTFTAPMETPASETEALDLKPDPIQSDATGHGLPVISMGGRQIFLWAQAKYSITGQLVAKTTYQRVYERSLPLGLCSGLGRCRNLPGSAPLQTDGAFLPLST